MTETVEEMVESIDKVVEDKELSKRIIRQFLDDFGGLQIYLPKSESAFKLDDDAAIYDEFNGSNKNEICRKWGISFNTFYVIIRREKDRRATAHAQKVEKTLDFG